MFSHPLVGSPCVKGLWAHGVCRFPGADAFHERSRGAPLECASLQPPGSGLWILVWGAGVCMCAHVCTHVCREGQMWWGGSSVSPTYSRARAQPCAMLTAFPLTLTVKKKCSAGLRLSHLMNLGRKKSTSLEPAERSLETASKERGRLPGRRACPLGCSPSPGRQLSGGRGCRSRFKRVVGMWSRGPVPVCLHCR